MSIEVITVATHSEGRYDKLINNDYGVKVTTLGWNQKWTGYQMKIELVYDYIKHLPDDKIVVFIDGFDSSIGGSIDEIKKRFESLNTPVLVSSEPSYMYNRLVFPSCGKNRMINAGMWMGYVKYLKMILNDIVNSKCNDDQVNFNKLCNKYDFMTLDNSELIFKNINFTLDFNTEVGKSNSILFQQPGSLTTNRYYRAIFEYGQFIYPQLLIVYAILMFICCKFNKPFCAFGVTLTSIMYAFNMEKSCINT